MHIREPHTTKKRRRQLRRIQVLLVGALVAGTTTAQGPLLEANPGQKQMEAAIHRYWEGVQSLDPIVFANNFAPDGTLEDPAGAGQLTVGRNAIAATYAAGLQVLGRITPRIKDIFVGAGQSTEATVRWELIAYTRTGKQVIVEGIGIFKFKPFQIGSSERLQLSSVREFYDPVQFASQLQ